jgi:hypothetical protein
VQHNRIFSTEDSYHPDITKMPQFSGWYDYSHPEYVALIGQQQAQTKSDALQALPPGKRVLFIRGMLVYESYQNFGADPMYIFENGGLQTSRMIAMLRPLGRELRRRGMHADGIWADNEGGWNFFQLTPEQLTAVLTSPRARAKMPPGVRALRPEMFVWGHPNLRNAVVTFDRWAYQLMYRSMRQALVQSGVFAYQPSPGAALVQPPISNFQVEAPTWQTYDLNGWPTFSFSLDGRTSCPGCAMGPGQRFSYLRVHDPRWNALADALNHFRSCMARPGAVVLPLIAWPDRFGNRWCFEKMIAHATRMGINYTGGGCSYIYWRDVDIDAVHQDPILADIFSRYDQPWAPIRNLPELQMDCDTITTGDLTTTYSEFLDNVPPLVVP